VALTQAEFDALLREHQRWWRGGGSGRQLDLTGRSLTGLQLAGRRVDGVLFNEVDLSGADLTGTDLSRTELIEANLRHANLATADLYKANLIGADLTGADLTGARLLRADLTEAVLAQAILDRTDLTRTFFLRTDLRGAKLRDARLDGAGFDDDRVSGWDATGATGTVLAGSMVIDADGLTDAIDSLRQAGALVGRSSERQDRDRSVVGIQRHRAPHGRCGEQRSGSRYRPRPPQVSAAMRIIGEMERFGLDLVEQPVSGRNLAEMAYVRARIAPPMLANEASWTRYDQLEVIRHVPYVDGCLELPTAPGIGVELDRERVAWYAEVYRTDATAFGFHDSRALSATPVLPKF